MWLTDDDRPLTRADLLSVHREVTALLAVLDRALAQRPSRKAKASEPKEHLIKAILTAFDEAWRRQYGEPYKRTHAAAEAKAAKLLTDETPARVEAWIDRYVRSDRPFLVEARHPFVLFVRTINEWRVAKRQAVSVTPDAEETAAYLRSLRSGNGAAG